MADEWHVKWLSEGVKQWNKRRKKVKFFPNLSGINFFDFLPLDFRDSPKTSRYFEKIDLTGADLTGASLANLNFANAKFDNAIMRWADLSRTNFSNASFRGANLELTNADNSIFLGADFRGAEVSQLSLQNSDLTKALVFETRLTADQIASAKSNLAIRSVSEWEMLKIPLKATLRSLGVMEKKARPESKVVFDVFYATNRCPIYVRNRLEGFNASINGSLSYGVCEVTLEDSGRVGKIGSSLWRKIFRKSAEDDKIDIIIEYSENLFWEYLRQNHERMSKLAAPTVFIHGFNTNFEAAVIRAAKVGHGLDLGQGIGLFSWPSSGDGVRTYVADLNTVEASKYALVNFIETFAANSPVGRINLIAHSMGCRLLVSAIEVMANKSSSYLASIDNLVLAAADVDTRVARQVAPIAFGKFGRSTSYVTEDDLALVTFASVGKYDRVGLTPPIFTHSGMDTIQVDGDDGSLLRHGYIATSRLLLNDLFYLLKDGQPPSQRHRLVQKVNGADIYWFLQP